MGNIFPKAPSLPVDPNLATQQQQAQDANVTALSNQARSDTASLMARYGTRLALAQMTGTPGVSLTTGGLSPMVGK